MAWFIGQSAVMIVLAFLVGLLVGWMIWHRRGDAPAPPRSADDRTTEITLADELTREISAPEPRAAADEARADDDPTEAIDLAPADDHPTVAIETETPDAADAPADAGDERAVGDDAAAEDATPAAGASEAEAADDLDRIEGIGPKIAAALSAAGVRTFAQLAAAPIEDLRAATRAAKITFTPSINTWSQQAALLADGDEDGFKTLTDRLIAGREPGARVGAGSVAGPAAGSVAADSVADDAAAALEPVEPDALDRIEGIGPKISAALIASNIRTYRELAVAGAPALERAINDAGIRFAPSITTWSRQAALLADGDEDGFKALTDRLIAGRDTGAGPAQDTAVRAQRDTNATDGTDGTDGTDRADDAPANEREKVHQA